MPRERRGGGAVNLNCDSNALAAPAAKSSLPRLALLGAVSAALVLATPFAFWHGGDNTYMVFAIATGLAAAAATGVAERCPTRQALWLIVTVAIALRIVALAIPPFLSTDIFRYVWDGKVQAAGFNPYRYVPADAALAALRDGTIYPDINRADYAVTIYPPVAEMFFFLVTRLGADVITMKLAMVACEGAIVGAIVLLLRRLGRPVTRIVAWAWHPLPIWEIAGNGHIDALMTALMMAGLCAALFGRGLRGAVAIALGALAKPFAVVVLPAVWRPWDWKAPAAVVVVVALCYAPYLSVGRGVLGFLTRGYLGEEKIASGDYLWPLAAWRWIVGTLPGDVLVYVAITAVAVAALALRSAFRRSASLQQKLAEINTLLLTFLLLLSPNYPWYFLMVTPFTALVGGAPVWTLTIGAVLLQEEAWWDPFVPVLVRKSLHGGAFLLACAYTVWRARRARDAARLEEAKHERGAR
ncbi:MAG TPA: glycosyltransferase 87 family protein [Xanthobacteraceae bacterium]|nr:glycosyltransferase 87 family protein [Xanthobacteraceae bacterium]